MIYQVSFRNLDTKIGNTFHYHSYAKAVRRYLEFRYDKRQPHQIPSKAKKMRKEEDDDIVNNKKIKFDKENNFFVTKSYKGSYGHKYVVSMRQIKTEDDPGITESELAETVISSKEYKLGCLQQQKKMIWESLESDYKKKALEYILSHDMKEDDKKVILKLMDNFKLINLERKVTNYGYDTITNSSVKIGIVENGKILFGFEWDKSSGIHSSSDRSKVYAYINEKVSGEICCIYGDFVIYNNSGFMRHKYKVDQTETMVRALMTALGYECFYSRFRTETYGRDVFRYKQNEYLTKKQKEEDYGCY